MNDLIYVEKIIDFIEKQGLTEVEFCSLAGIPHESLTRLKQNNNNVDLCHIFKIIRYMKWTLSEFCKPLNRC